MQMDRQDMEQLASPRGIPLDDLHNSDISEPVLTWTWTDIIITPILQIRKQAQRYWANCPRFCSWAGNTAVVL